MPGAGEITDGLTAIANGWMPLAVMWHVYFAALAAGLLAGIRPSQRFVGLALVLPLLSVGGLAVHAGNPFNTGVFGLLAAVLSVTTIRWRPEPVEPASGPWIAAGSALFAFGWSYPHFLEGVSPVAYLYAAPLGLVPCPTLSMLAGVTLCLGGLKSIAWPAVLGVAALFYSVFGAVHLGVAIDWVLAGGALCLFVQRRARAVR